MNVGSGGVEGDVSYGGDIREPATGDSAARTDAGGESSLPQGVGREGHDGLGGLPGDAVKK